MAETKIVMFIINWVGVPVYLAALFLNIETWKGWILTAIALLYGIARLIFYCIKEYQEMQMRDIERKKELKQLDKK